MPLVGTGVTRADDPRLLTGRGRYVDNLALPRMVHAAFVRSPHAHARIAALDVDAARQMPGVVAILTGEDAARVCKPYRGVLLHYEVTLWMSTQVPHMMQAVVADLFGLAEHRVRVIAPDVGGSFGIKIHVYQDDMAAIALALALGRPVKWVATRSESFVSDIHAREQTIDVEAGADAQRSRSGRDSRCPASSS